MHEGVDTEPHGDKHTLSHVNETYDSTFVPGSAIGNKNQDALQNFGNAQIIESYPLETFANYAQADPEVDVVGLVELNIDGFEVGTGETSETFDLQHPMRVAWLYYALKEATVSPLDMALKSWSFGTNANGNIESVTATWDNQSGGINTVDMGVVGFLSQADNADPDPTA